MKIRNKAKERPLTASQIQQFEGMACEKLRELTGSRELAPLGSLAGEMMKYVIAQVTTAYANRQPVNKALRASVLAWAQQNVNDRLLPPHQKPVPTAPSHDTNPGDTLQNATVAELRGMAQTLGIDVPTKAKRDDLIVLVRQATEPDDPETTTDPDA